MQRLSWSAQPGSDALGLLALQGDARSVDELLSFIGGEGQREAVATEKKKKKKGKKRAGRGAASDEQAGDDTPDIDGAQAARTAANAPRHVHRRSVSCAARSAYVWFRQGPGSSVHELFPEDGFDDDDGDDLGDDIDPEMLARVDLEVEAFTRRLNAKWQPRPAPPPQASAQKSMQDNVAAVRSLLTSCIQSLGLTDQLQVRAPVLARAGQRAVVLTAISYTLR